MNEQWLLIGLLAIVVFGIRVIGLEWLGKRTFPPLLKRFFLLCSNWYYDGSACEASTCLA